MSYRVLNIISGFFSSYSLHNGPDVIMEGGKEKASTRRGLLILHNLYVSFTSRNYIIHSQVVSVVWHKIHYCKVVYFSYSYNTLPLQAAYSNLS